MTSLLLANPQSGCNKYARPSDSENGTDADTQTPEYSRFATAKSDLQNHLDKVSALVAKTETPTTPLDKGMLDQIDILVHGGNGKILDLQEAAHFLLATRSGSKLKAKVDEQVHSLNEIWASHQLGLCQLKARCLKSRQYQDLVVVIEKFHADSCTLEKQANKLEAQWKKIIESSKDQQQQQQQQKPSASEDSNDVHSFDGPESRISASRLAESLRQKLLVTETKSYEKEERAVLQVEKANRSMNTRLHLLERRVGIFCESGNGVLNGLDSASLTVPYTHPVTKAKFFPPSHNATQTMELQMKMREIKQVFGKVGPIIANLKSLIRIQHTLTKYDVIISEISAHATSMRGRAHQTMQRARRLSSIKATSNGRRSPRFSEQAIEWQIRMNKRLGQASAEVQGLLDKLTSYLIARANLPVLEKLSEKYSLAKRSWCEAKDLARDSMAQLESAIEAHNQEMEYSAQKSKQAGNDIVDRAANESDDFEDTDTDAIRYSVSGNGGQHPSLPPLTEEDSQPSSPLNADILAKAEPLGISRSHHSVTEKSPAVQQHHQFQSPRPRHNSSSLGTPQQRLRRPISQVSFIASPNMSSQSPSILHRPSMNDLSAKRNSMLVPPTYSVSSGQQHRNLQHVRSFVRSPPPSANAIQSPNPFTITLSNVPSRQRLSSVDATSNSHPGLSHRNSIVDNIGGRPSGIPSPRGSIDLSRPLLNHMSSANFDNNNNNSSNGGNDRSIGKSLLHRPTQLRSRVNSIGQSPMLNSRASISDFSPRTSVFQRNSTVIYPTDAQMSPSMNHYDHQHPGPRSRDSTESNSSASDHGALSQIWSSPSFNAVTNNNSVGNGLHRKISVVKLSESIQRTQSQKSEVEDISRESMPSDLVKSDNFEICSPSLIPTRKYSMQYNSSNRVL